MEKTFDLARENRYRLDIGVESAYTTEFLDGSEKPAEGRHRRKRQKEHALRGMCKKHEEGNGQGQGWHGQEKARLLQKEIAGAAGRVEEDHSADTGRRPHGGRRSDGGSGGQGGELLYERVSLWND